MWMIIPSYSDSRFGVFFDIFCDTKFSVLGRSRPMLTNQKCPSHTNQPIRVNLSRGLFRSEHPTLFSTPPSLHNLCFPIQYTLTSIFSNERPLVDLNFFRKRNEPKTSNRFQLLKFKSHVGLLCAFICVCTNFKPRIWSN